MRRSPKPAKAKVEAQPGKSSKNDAAQVRDLEKRLAEALKREAEALEQQTATAEILRVISTSPTEIQPVLDTVARTAARLCDAVDASIHRLDGDRLRIAAHYGPIPLLQVVLDEGWPLDAGSVTGRAILENRRIHVEDLASADEFPVGREYARRLGHRTTLAVPLLRQGLAIGAIVVRREQIRPFTEIQIALLQTFADQAVIAIENVRLFRELQARNSQLSEALDQQTATSEILRLISQSPTDFQPVFEAIVASAARLCDAAFSAVTRFEGGLLHLVAVNHVTPEETEAYRSLFPRTPGRHFIMGRAFVDGQPVHVEDVLTDPDYDSRRLEVLQRAGVFRTYLGVPIIRDGVPIGAIGCGQREVRPFTATQIELVKTFADQAVIAIENVRLFKELQERTAQLTRSVEKLTAMGDVGRALSSTLDLDTVLQTIVARASQLAGTDACSVLEYDEATEAFYLRATNNLEDEVVALAKRTPTRKGEGVLGRMAVTLQPVQVPDIAAEDAYHGPLRDILLRTGTRAVLAIPMVREAHLIGGLTVNKKTPGEFMPEVIELLTTFATQSALAIQNARLFLEIEVKGRELEAASRHKSEFLANMSHELRTPLNAIIGFSEVLTERMFGELNEKQDEYLKDIYASGQHLLSLINDILDLSKIEAGRMELELADFHLPQAIENALVLVRERALRRGITLEQSIDPRLGEIQGDERKVKQVLLNLLSNAIKFTPESGRIDVRAKPVNGSVEIAVSDTGVGIAPEDQQAILEEFRQVGTAAKKVEGTGLGLALSRKFIELHGGGIWIESEIGVGSTFTFTLPVRRGE